MRVGIAADLRGYGSKDDLRDRLSAQVMAMLSCAVDCAMPCVH
jgi:hypothetical protein